MFIFTFYIVRAYELSDTRVITNNLFLSPSDYFNYKMSKTFGLFHQSKKILNTIVAYSKAKHIEAMKHLFVMF